MEKRAWEVAVGDRVESVDGFTLFYMTITKEPEPDTNGSDFWYVLTGEDDCGEPGELYIDPIELVEVVA